MNMQAESPELSLEMVQDFLSQLVVAQAIKEQEAAQLVAEFMAGSPQRIFALVEQYLEAQKVTTNPKMLRFKYLGGIEVNPDYLWSLVIPNSWEDAAFKFSAGLVISIMLALTANALFPPTPPNVSQQELRTWA
jgi:hypothetical protein